MNKSIIVYGPQGCGKTRYAKRIAKHFGLESIVDDSDAVCFEIQLCGVLYLTSDMRTPHVLKFTREAGMVFSFAEVAKQINDAIPLTDWQSGPPPMDGEWNASAYQDPGMRRWWNGDFWSMGWSKNHHQDTANQRAKITTAKNFSERIFWRGLSEEPIVVQGGA